MGTITMAPSVIPTAANLPKSGSHAAVSDERPVQQSQIMVSYNEDKKRSEVKS